jgi:pimeloyl-ACP methyl ester carboxylesterase
VVTQRDTWFLLRGLTREAAHWGEFLTALRAAWPDVDVHALDLPGAGAWHAGAWSGGVAEAMEQVRAEAARRAPQARRRFVFGVSLGGMITMAWAARYPEELGGIAVGASSARDLSPFWKRMRPGALRGIVLGNLERDVARREAAVVRAVCNRSELWDETAAAWAEIQRTRPVSRQNARAQIQAAAAWRAPARLAVSALFLVGNGDRLVHPDCSRALARRYGAPLVEHPHAGHDLTTDAADWVIEELTRWRQGV